jgi:hypothetical protein
MGAKRQSSQLSGVGFIENYYICLLANVHLQIICVTLIAFDITESDHSNRLSAFYINNMFLGFVGLPLRGRSLPCDTPGPTFSQ